jgi:hypothetical protein
MIVILMRREQSETVCATLRETTVWRSVYNQLRQRGQLTTYEELRQSHRVSSIVAWN